MIGARGCLHELYYPIVCPFKVLFLLCGCTLHIVKMFRATACRVIGQVSRRWYSNGVKAAVLPTARFSHPVQLAKNNRTRLDGIKIYKNALEAMSPASMVSKALSYNSDTKTLLVDGQSYKVDKNVHIIAFGKAVLGMARAAEDILGDEIVTSVVSVPKGIMHELREANKHGELLKVDTKCTVYEGESDELAGETSREAAQHALRVADSVGENDIVLVLISGGGSSLLPAPLPPLTLKEKSDILELLRYEGASTRELNLVRKHLSLVKGGGLGARALPAKVISLILTNMDEDPLGVGSSPTVTDTSTAQQALHILRKYNVYEQASETVRDLLQGELEHVKTKRWIEGDLLYPEEIFSGTRATQANDCSHVQNVLVGSCLQLLHEVSKECLKKGYLPYIFDPVMKQNSEDMANKMAVLSWYMCEKLTANRSLSDGLIVGELECVRAGITKDQLRDISLLLEKAMNTKKSVSILCAGELTVNVQGTGTGGQNMEFCLASSIELAKMYESHDALHGKDVQILSVDTDGFDGATDASGAFADCHQATSVFGGKTAKDHLEDNDSYGFYTQFSDQMYTVKTGRTGVDLMDFQMLLIKRR